MTSPLPPLGGPASVPRLPNRFILPAPLTSLIPESELLAELHEIESQVDSLLQQRRLEIYRATDSREVTHVAKVRVYIYTTQHAASATDPACWTLHLQGRMLDLDDNEISTLAGVPNFTALIKNLRVRFSRVDGAPLDPESFGGATDITWSKHRSAAPATDALEIHRLGSPGGIRVQLTLDLQRDGDDVVVSEELAAVLGSTFLSTSEVLPKLWKYLVEERLFMPDKGGNFATFKCDEKLKAAFGADTVPVLGLKAQLAKHLSRPTELDLTLDLVEGSSSGPLGSNGKEGANQEGPSRSPHNINCYDLMIVLTASKEYLLHLAATEGKANIAVSAEDRLADQHAEGTMAELCRNIEERRRKRAFFLGFAENPSLFITDMMESHGLDLRESINPLNQTKEVVAMDRSSLFGSGAWVEEAVTRYQFKELQVSQAQPEKGAAGGAGAAEQAQMAPGLAGGAGGSQSDLSRMGTPGAQTPQPGAGGN